MGARRALTAAFAGDFPKHDRRPACRDNAPSRASIRTVVVQISANSALISSASKLTASTAEMTHHWQIAWMTANSR
jgi:hypothetical protein